MMMDLRKGLRSLGLETSGARVEKLERFIAEINLWNPRYGLVAAGEDIVGRHVIDSLSGVELIRGMNPGSLADVGSGAGFPGIPLALWLDDTEITLIERSGRRADFLRNTVLALGLKNVRVLEMPVENVFRASGSRFDVITFRAWSALDDSILESLSAILEPGGTIAAYKGRREVIDAELKSISREISSTDIRKLGLPESGEERHLVLIRLPG
jgi:16S rRNA (guanine527-N7)-methyltransferase